MKKINKLFSKYNNQSKKKSSSTKKDYFMQASNWADDYYTIIEASRNRYKFTSILLSCVSAILLFSTLSLVHTHEYIPLLVHHYDSGAVSVEPVKQHYAPTAAEVESELVRYVINRESYDPASFSESYQLVHVMSDDNVARRYSEDQNAEDKRSFIYRFGEKTIRSVHIESVNFLDNEELNKEEKGAKNHKNLAEVNFIVSDKDFQGGKRKQMSYVAIISWTHTGIPEDPEIRWMNWDGFVVTSYQVNQRTVSSTLTI